MISVNLTIFLVNTDRIKVDVFRYNLERRPRVLRLFRDFLLPVQWNELVLKILVGALNIGNMMQPRLWNQSVLERIECPFEPSFTLGRICKDDLDP